MKPTDEIVLAELRKTVWADLDEITFDLVCKAVEEAGDIRNTSGYAMTLIEKAIIEKARFSSRSEAGRYAANVRWQSQGGAKEAPKASDRYKNMSDAELKRTLEQAQRVLNSELDNMQTAGAETQQRVIDRLNEEMARREKEKVSAPKSTGSGKRSEAVSERDSQLIQKGDLNEISNLIFEDFREQGKKIPVPLSPYLDAMSTLRSVKDNYGMDSGRSVVAYALSNMGTYKGATARAIKARLKELIK